MEAKEIDSDLLENYWMYGAQQATLKKRPVGEKAWGRRKTREETLKMIRAERERILRTANQRIVVCIDDMQRTIRQPELDKILRTGTLSEPLCRLGGLIVS